MKSSDLLKRHIRFKDKNMKELIEERHMEQLKSQNELRKRYLPEKYKADIDK